MHEHFTEIENRVRQHLPLVVDLSTWEKYYHETLGRRGELTQALRAVGEMPEAERREAGRMGNIVKQRVELLFSKRREELGGMQTQATTSIDVTLPGKRQVNGRLHPVSILKYQIWDIFQSMGFDVHETQEVESDFFNFQALNMPPDHPARDMQDTFYISDDVLLRTHATSFQGRVLKGATLPLRAISTGRCFRRDSDMTHTPMFHQFDGIMVDEKVTMADLKGTLQEVMSRLLEKEVKVRFRYSYFPFVEPGAEFDVSCSLCDGRGCRTCKGTGWLEMGGAGMIHPKVFGAVGINPKKYQGWAFGFGIERPFMIKHGVGDIRLLYENDVRFLEQF